jgi:alkanesulfonate monooxygenase SsuD/methylene tetrahydromethanopterin reductase-like flavin-dependent oxidoreductase (luciferase family)
LELVPDELVREVFLFGSGDAQRERLGEFADGGITTFVLTPVCEPADVPRYVDGMAPRR